MARAKNTTRSEARRRTREVTRAEIAAEQEPEDGGEAVEATDAAATKRPRRSGFLFKWPDVPADIRSVPGMFRKRRLLWLPFILAVIGFVLGLVADSIPAEFQPYVGLYYQWFFNPLALFTYFIAGFLATRASYLVGGLAGLFVGILYTLLIAILGQPADVEATTTSGDLAFASAVIVFEAVVIGTFAGGFAGWYRDYLRNMQTKSRARQAEREAAEKAKRRDERQEARRSAKQRPAN